jgi:hypothetical protein
MPDDIRHQLWLIYEQLNDAESDSERQLELLQQSRQELSEIINQLNRRLSLAYMQSWQTTAPRRQDRSQSSRIQGKR